MGGRCYAAVIERLVPAFNTRNAQPGSARTVTATDPAWDESGVRRGLALGQQRLALCLLCGTVDELRSPANGVACPPGGDDHHAVVGFVL